uniref:Glucuronosyltransferase n=1 Tax=Ditylenchus dipsaci TaxID=166011 RepID=A0A915DBV7_9BILA
MLRKQVDESLSIAAEPKDLWFHHRFRYFILLLGFLCTTSISANMGAFNFTVICMISSPNVITQEPELLSYLPNNLSSTLDYYYLEHDRNVMMWSLALGTLLSTLPCSFVLQHHYAFPFVAMHMHFGYLLLLRFLQGVAYAADFAAMGMLCSKWASLTQYGLFLSVVSSYSPASSLITNSVSSQLCVSKHGWPMVYYSFSAVGVLIAFLWLYFYNDQPCTNPFVSSLELERINRGKDIAHVNTSKFVPYKDKVFLRKNQDDILQLAECGCSWLTLPSNCLFPQSTILFPRLLLVAVFFAPAGGAFYKCAMFSSRQYSHFVMANIQINKCIAMFLSPALMAVFVTDVNDADQWKIIFILFGVLCLLANTLFCFTATDEPAEFTKITSSRRKSIMYISGKMMKLLILTVSFGIITTGNAYKILVFNPILSQSHTLLLRRLADTLAKDGNHDVTIWEPEYFRSVDELDPPKLAKRVVVRDLLVGRSISKEDMTSKMGQLARVSFEPVSLRQKINMLTFFNQIITNACEALLNRTDILEQLKQEKFDAFIGSPITLCGSGVSRLIGIPTHIVFATGPLMDHTSSVIGLPAPTSFVPSVSEISYYTDKLNFVQRFTNLVMSGFNYVFFSLASQSITHLFRTNYGPDFPTMDEICRDSALILVNTDELVEFPRPIYHNVIFIGGFGATQKGKQSDHVPLSSPYDLELEKGDLGIVYFSLGTNVQTSMLPEVFRQNLVDTFATFTAYHFILKVDQQDKFTQQLAKQSSNIFTTHWAHKPGFWPILEPNCLLVMVATTVSFFGDQLHNAKLAERNGWGLSVDKTKIMDGTQDFQQTIQMVLNNQSFTTNARRTKRLIDTKPFSSNEKLLKHIKFLELNNGQLPELMNEGRMLGIMQFYNWDIIAMLASLPNRNILPGQSFKVNIRLRNHCSAKICKIQFSLIQIARYCFIGAGSTTSCQCVAAESIKVSIRSFSESIHNCSLSIPSSIVPSFDNCVLIHVEYVLKNVIYFKGLLAKNISCEIPVVVSNSGR